MWKKKSTKYQYFHLKWEFFFLYIYFTILRIKHNLKELDGNFEIFALETYLPQNKSIKESNRYNFKHWQIIATLGSQTQFLQYLIDNVSKRYWPIKIIFIKLKGINFVQSIWDIKWCDVKYIKDNMIVGNSRETYEESNFTHGLKTNNLYVMILWRELFASLYIIKHLTYIITYMWIAFYELMLAYFNRYNPSNDRYTIS